jgi:hypothetical protein
MNPLEFLFDFMIDNFGRDVVPKSRPTPAPSMRDIPFGPYQPLINRARQVTDDLNEQTRRKQQIIDEQLGRY